MEFVRFRTIIHNYGYRILSMNEYREDGEIFLQCVVTDKELTKTIRKWGFYEDVFGSIVDEIKEEEDI